MHKSKSRFETIPLKALRHLLQDGKNSGPETETRNDGVDSSTAARPTQPARSNVQKQRARPKRSIKTEGQDHPLGLWLDRDVLRKHQNPTPRVAFHTPLANTNNLYLTLADLALGNNKPKSRKNANQAEGTSRS